MILAPGLIRSEQIPSWLWEIQIGEFYGKFPHEVRKMPLTDRRNTMTYLRGRGRAQEQQDRKNKNK